MGGIFALLAIFSGLLPVVKSEGNIGCLFTDSVCTKQEWCFDDAAFGRCLPVNGKLSASSFYQYDLKLEMLVKLEEEMNRLFQEGYQWSHAYTQCILQNLLNSYRYGFDYEPSLCTRVAGLDQSAMDFQPEVLPRDLAVIHFDPATGLDQLSEFASEWFIPPLHEPQRKQPDLYGSARRYSTDDSGEELNTEQQTKVKRYKNPNGVQKNDRKMLDLLDLLIDQTNDVFPDAVGDKNERMDITEPSPSRQLYSDVSPEEFDQLQALFSASAPVQPSQEFSDGGGEWLGDSDYAWGNSPVNLNDQSPESYSSPSGGEDENYWDSGFKRLHRYDVKKPGPNFMNNLDDFDSTEAVVNEQLQQVSIYKLLEDMLNNKTLNLEEDQKFTADGMSHSNSATDGEKEYETHIAPKSNQRTEKSEITLETSKRKQEIANGKVITPSLYGIQQYNHKDLAVEAAKDYDVVDTSYAFISVENGFNDYVDGKEFVKKLEKLLKLPEHTFSNIVVDKNQVNFKVNPNPHGLNASTVASQAESLKNELKESTGKVVSSTGIGNQVKISVLNLDSDKKLFIITFVVCGCVAGVLIAVALLYIIRRHARSKEKLQALSQQDTEPSHDYQDLCRQRMANKNNEKSEPINVAQRVTSLSRESEASARSPSSRSSTSSWSEEPVSSNMDISTGHMVLSYMEDHLKNKDRLEQEWVALCAYEAEPCNVSAANAAENTKKNRYPEVLPYDHSRVVLNDLTNINGSDYINASTITDHDPRNPAYIATQGPLPHTAADFWQMVWEQGSVVVVTLTRLVENGIAMCHRYWPEEGSELYHIYEVHLVSEHIWCDDYLVRSFYLKNFKTGETRTVTQFHFLSWPENGVPVSIKALLDFRRKVNKSYRGRSCPIVVHCSDGSGRTGTYCLIDMVLNRMAKGAKEIDIAATLEHIRDQRPYMVKTKGQFEFVLMAVAEEVHAILKALPQ